MKDLNYGQSKQVDPRLTDENRELVSLLTQALLKQNNGVNGNAVRSVNNRENETINLVELFWHVMSKLYIVVIAAVVGTLIGFLYADYFYVPTYSATAKLYILSGSDAMISLSDLQLGNALGPDYTEVFKTWEVSEMVREELKLDYSYNQLYDMLSVTIPSNSRVLYLTVRSKDAQEAADIANAFANCAKRFIMEVMNSEEPNNFSMALVPGVPSTRGKTYYIEMGFLISSLLALGLIVLVYLLDKRPRSAEDIARLTGLPVLSVIPREAEYERMAGSTKAGKHRRKKINSLLPKVKGK